MTDDAISIRGGGRVTDELALDAPITAVTVYPAQARITRRGRLRPAPGEHRVILEPLPLTLLPDSVRVAGVGAATVLGVDVVRRHQPRTTDETARELEEELRQARAGLAALEDEDAVAAERLAFYSGLARRATRAYATALAAGGSDPARVSELADALAAAQTTVRETRRVLAERRERLQEQIKAYERGLEARRRQREPDHVAVVVNLLAGEGATGGVEAGEVELELDVSYVVDGAGWYSVYDLRLAEEALTLRWFGLVTQRTGEDWPECDLRLSTARPSGSMAVPEVDPWFLDRVRPMPAPESVPLAMRRAQAAVGYAAEEVAGGMVADVMATVEEGVTAATYRPTRPVAVPADGSAHRVSLAVVELPAALDYVTAPVRAVEAYLRATVTNTSAHTFPVGAAAVFQGGDFVGNSALATWAPGEEVELALGIDDRIRIERELVRRTATKAVLGATRRREAEHRITITNHTPHPARIRVLDQLPVSRDDGIVVKELRVEPAPAERTELGVLTWELTLAPGEEKKIYLGVRVELGRGVELAGWRE